MGSVMERSTNKRYDDFKGSPRQGEFESVSATATVAGFGLVCFRQWVGPPSLLSSRPDGHHLYCSKRSLTTPP